MTYRPYNIIIQEAQATAGAVRYTLTNSSGSPIPSLRPVSSSASGEIKPCLPNNETDSLSIIGVTEESILNATEGSVMALGRILNVSSLGFSLNDNIYVNKIGQLSNIIPDIDVDSFVETDFVIYIGKIIKNQSNPLEQDLLVNPKLLGQL